MSRAVARKNPFAVDQRSRRYFALGSLSCSAASFRRISVRLRTMIERFKIMRVVAPEIRAIVKRQEEIRGFIYP